MLPNLLWNQKIRLSPYFSLTAEKEGFEPSIGELTPITG